MANTKCRKTSRWPFLDLEKVIGVTVVDLQNLYKLLEIMAWLVLLGGFRFPVGRDGARLRAGTSPVIYCHLNSSRFLVDMVCYCMWLSSLVFSRGKRARQ